jgi:hypothetical protein
LSLRQAAAEVPDAVRSTLEYSEPRYTDGVLADVERLFRTQQSWEAKELTHQAYERLRDPLTSKVEETELEAYQRRVNALVKRPPDVFRIEDYPPEKRNG